MKLGTVPQHLFPEPDEPDPDEIPEEFINDQGEVDWTAVEAAEDAAKEEAAFTIWEIKNDENRIRNTP